MASESDYRSAILGRLMKKYNVTQEEVKAGTLIQDVSRKQVEETSAAAALGQAHSAPQTATTATSTSATAAVMPGLGSGNLQLPWATNGNERLTGDISSEVIPKHYELAFTIASDGVSDFTCEETIQITVRRKGISRILMHGHRHLKVSSLTYTDNVQNPQPCRLQQSDDNDDVAEIHFDKPLPEGNGHLRIQFQGPITNDFTGLYRMQTLGGPLNAGQVNTSRYSYNFATQLEPCFARRVFFCWDLPHIKATFQVSLTIPKTWIALSNTVLEEIAVSESDATLAITKFQPTPIMSTYLLAFVVGSFHCVEGLEDGIVCRVHTPVDKRELGAHSLNVALKSLSFFTYYFGTRFPLSKLDIVGVPEFTSGSMENTGLIVLKYPFVLIDEKGSTFFTKQRSMLVLCHEISHQWFGNMVTINNPDLWFKEALASFLEYSCAESINPKSDIWLHFTVYVCLRALSMDSMDSNPISVLNNNDNAASANSDGTTNFNTISHLKGACVIRMLNSFITFQTYLIFLNAVREFIKSNLYKTSSALGFWRALEDAGFVDAANIAKSWTSQTGFPLIKIAEMKQTKDSRTFVLTQEKFCANPRFNGHKKELKSFRWHIPLEFVSGKEPKKIVKTVLMKSSMMEVSIPDVHSGDWVKIRSVGFFRVHYPPSLMKNFLSAVKSKQMQPVDRIGLLDDLFHLCRCGEVSTVDVLETLKSYDHEPNYYVWEAISTVLKSLNTLFEFTSFHEKFQEFGVSILRKVHRRLGFDASGKEKEGPLEEQLRVMILLRLIELNEKDVIEECVKRFQKCVHANDLSLIPAYMRPVVFSGAVVGGADMFRYLLAVFKSNMASSLEEETQILRALCYTKTDDTITLLFDYILGGQAKPSVISAILYSLCFSRMGIEKVWNFFRSNDDFVLARFRTCSAIQTLLKRMIEDFCDSTVAAEIEEFFTTKESWQFLRGTVSQGIESIKIREAWIARDKDEVDAYLIKETAKLIIID